MIRINNDKGTLEEERAELYRLLASEDIDQELIIKQSHKLDKLIVVYIKSIIVPTMSMD